MKRYALLCGCAPEGFRQKKLIAFHDSLISHEGFSERDIVVFPNGVSEIFLEYAFSKIFSDIGNCIGHNCVEQKGEGCVADFLLYICALCESDFGGEVIRLGTDEIRYDVIRHYEHLAREVGAGFRLVCEADSEPVREEDAGYEKV